MVLHWFATCPQETSQNAKRPNLQAVLDKGQTVPQPARRSPRQPKKKLEKSRHTSLGSKLNGVWSESVENVSKPNPTAPKTSRNESHEIRWKIRFLQLSQQIKTCVNKVYHALEFLSFSAPDSTPKEKKLTVLTCLTAARPP